MDSETIDNGVWNKMLETYRTIKAAKPGDRSDADRRYAILLTEYEKVMAYYLVMCSNNDFVG